tara:strand:+ start:2099 stop:2845 length:747 start_codon:yes stop_codon:yes gene_type:complete
MDEVSSSSFLIKLKHFLLSLNNSSILQISKCGSKFKVLSEFLFIVELELSNKFRMSKINSFYKQLNLYNFRKIRSGEYEGYYENGYFNINYSDKYLSKYKRSDLFKEKMNEKIKEKELKKTCNLINSKRKIEENITEKKKKHRVSKRIMDNEISKLNSHNELIRNLEKKGINSNIEVVYVPYPVSVHVPVPVPIPVPINEKHMIIMNKINFESNDHNIKNIIDYEYLYRINQLENIDNPNETNIEDYF